MFQFQSYYQHATSQKSMSLYFQCFVYFKTQNGSTSSPKLPDPIGKERANSIPVSLFSVLLLCTVYYLLFCFNMSSCVSCDCFVAIFIIYFFVIRVTIQLVTPISTPVALSRSRQERVGQAALLVVLPPTPDSTSDSRDRNGKIRKWSV